MKEFPFTSTNSFGGFNLIVIPSHLYQKGHGCLTLGPEDYAEFLLYQKIKLDKLNDTTTQNQTNLSTPGSQF